MPTFCCIRAFLAAGAALDDRIACAETALRPLSTREIVKHLDPRILLDTLLHRFSIDHDEQ